MTQFARCGVRLALAEFDFYVDVSLIHAEERWLAIADIASEMELGAGTSVHGAVASALESLGGGAADAFARRASNMISGLG